jgi:hypothetical protein
MTRIILEDIKTDDIAVKMKALNDLAKSLERI